MISNNFSFLVMSKKNFEKVMTSFSKYGQSRINNIEGLKDRYAYFNRGIHSKPSYKSVFNEYHDYLDSDIRNLRMANPVRYNSLKELSEIKDMVLAIVEMDINEKYNSDIYLTKIGDFNSYDSIIDVMNSINDNKEYKILDASDINFMICHMLSTRCDNRMVCDVFNYSYITSNMFEGIYNSHKEKFAEDQFINFDLMNKITSADLKLVLFYMIDTFFKNKNVLKQNICKYIEFSAKEGSRYDIHRAFDVTKNRLVKDNFNNQDTIDVIDKLLPTFKEVNRVHYLYSFTTDNFINNNTKYIFDIIIKNKKYSKLDINFFLNNKDKIDIKLINKRKFVSSASLTEYNMLMGITTDPIIENMTDYINEAGTIIGERLITLACFTNMYSTEEFKKLNLDPIGEALANKLLAKYEYEMKRSPITKFIGDRNENLQYLCDVCIKKISELGLNSDSRIKIIKQNSSNDNIYYFLSKSVDNSDDKKIMKAVLKYSI